MDKDLIVTCELSNDTYGHTKADVKTMKWSRYTSTLAELIDEIGKGRAICPTTRKLNEVPKVSCNIMMYDIDNTFDEMRDYIAKLKVKPTFAYTTPSHKVVDEKHKGESRFRLVYVFDSTFSGEYFSGLYLKIAESNKFEGLDRRQSNQMYYGNDIAEWWLDGEVLDTPSVDQLSMIKKLADETHQDTQTNRPSKSIHSPKNTPFTQELINDYFRAESLTTFKNNHLDEIPSIITATQYIEVKGKDYLVPNGIRCRLPRLNDGLKWQRNRNSTTYNAGIIMLYLNPTLTADDFLLCFVNEFLTYYWEDEKWNKNKLLAKITECWAAYYVKGVRPIDNESMPKSKPNPRICKAQRKSKQAAAPTTSMHHRWDFEFNPAEWYDPTKTISENLTAIASPTKWKKAYGFDGKKIARNTLIAALQKQHIATYEERKENAIICAYIWGAESAKDLQKCGEFTLDPKTARKRFNDFESGRTSEITSKPFYFWMLNRINLEAKEHNFNDIIKKEKRRNFIKSDLIGTILLYHLRYQLNCY